MMDKLSTRILILIFVAVLLVCAFVYFGAMRASAEESAPALPLVAKNLAYKDELKLLFAVGTEGVEDPSAMRLLVFSDAPADGLYTKDNASAILSPSADLLFQGTPCKVFYSEGIAARRMTDELLLRPYVSQNGEDCYGELIRTSVADYAYKMLADPTISETLRALLLNMLDYGAAAQIAFGYRTDDLANVDPEKYVYVTVSGCRTAGGETALVVERGTVLSLVPGELPEGKRFRGFSVDGGAPTVFDGNYTVTADVSLSAVYSDPPAYLSSLSSHVSVEYGASYGDPDLPVRETVSLGGSLSTEIVWEEVPLSIGENLCAGALADPSDYVRLGILPEDLVRTVTVYPFTTEEGSEENTVVLKKYYGSETSVIVPSTYTVGDPAVTKTVVGVKKNAFSSMKGLTSLSIPITVTSMEAGALNGCSSLVSLTAPFLGESVNSPSSAAFLADTATGNNPLKDGTLTKVILTRTTAIAERGFSQCDALRQIHLPSTLTSVGADAFDSCAELTTVVFDDLSVGSSLTIDIGAFNGCYNLETVDLPEGLTKLGAYCFSYCRALKTIVLPASLPTESGTNAVESSCFYNCSGLTSVVFSSGVYNIAEYTFSGCSSLSSVTFASGTWSIGMEAFKDCAKLKQITLPPTLHDIGINAFLNSGLERVDYAPGAMKNGTIYGFAFVGTKLKWFYVPDYEFFKVYAKDFPSDCVFYFGGTEIPETRFKDDVKAKMYAYSETYAENCWHYDESGDPVLWTLPDPE